MTFFYKRVFPCLFFGGLLLFVCIWLPDAINNPAPDLLIGSVVLVVMVVFGYALMRALVFDLLDEVYLGQDEIVVRNRGTRIDFPCQTSSTSMPAYW
jgi:hypothetical protein